MGQEITTRHFSADDFVAFKQALQQETELLTRWFQQGLFSSRALVGGYEMEAWLIDAEGRPAARNQAFLELPPTRCTAPSWRSSILKSIPIHCASSGIFYPTSKKIFSITGCIAKPLPRAWTVDYSPPVYCRPCRTKT